jgi:hypothetical protein
MPHKGLVPQNFKEGVFTESQAGVGTYHFTT